MNAIVCVKQVPDPEAPPASYKVDAASNRMVPAAGVPMVLSPFDEQAVEAALKLKDAQGGKITVLSLGHKLVRDVVKKGLAMGADELVLLEDETFADVDSWSTASALAAAIKKLGSFDLVFCGRQASDWNAGQVGLGIAELLGLPIVTLAKKVEIKGSEARVERVTDDGYEVVMVPLPALVTVTSELGQPRYPTIKGIMAANKKELLVWKPADIGLTPDQAGRRTQLLRLFQPVRERKCEMVGGATPEEKAVNLALKLRDAKVL